MGSGERMQNKVLRDTKLSQVDLVRQEQTDSSTFPRLTAAVRETSQTHGVLLLLLLLLLLCVCADCSLQRTACCLLW
jgi:hypothetical protein